MTRILLTLAVVALLAAAFTLTGCQTIPQTAEKPAEPVPAIYAIHGRPVVCLSEPHEGMETWRAMCAPMGPWMACSETETTLKCRTGTPVGRWQ